MITRLLEWLAPHHSLEDQTVDGPDTRSFLTRMVEAEGEGRVFWEHHWYTDGGIGWPSVDAFLGWSVTHLGFGLDIEIEPASKGVYGGPGSVSVALAVGPLWLSVRREWLNEERRRQEWITLKSLRAARRSS